MKQTAVAPKSERVIQWLKPFVELVYAPLGVDVDALCDRIYALIEPRVEKIRTRYIERWTQDDVWLITYGDSVVAQESEKPLEILYRVLETYLKDTITGVHILPFFPYSSDDGFAVIDYLQVNPDLGDWDEIQAIAQQFDLMTDVVINHASSQNQWFLEFQQGQKPGCDYFMTVDPSTDLSDVVRPRNTPLLCPVETPAGTKHVWATFSHDQIDLNFANPDVLIECLKIIL
ncbi:MAG: alpha-amylase family glycosyl hydrolase, partial [Cyanobacteria bacterium P01_H01_bin.121]